MRKSIVSLLLGFGLLFALNPQTASKEDLLKIKGVGEAKADAIVKYRKMNKLKTAQDLMQVKGIGEVIAQNILKDVLNGEKSSSVKKNKNKTKVTTKPKEKKLNEKKPKVKKPKVKKPKDVKPSNKPSDKKGKKGKEAA